MASSSSGASLPSLYRDASESLRKFEDGEINARDQDFAQTLGQLIHKFKECLQLIESHSLFSTNEEVEDVATAYLKYVPIAPSVTLEPPMTRFFVVIAIPPFSPLY